MYWREEQINPSKQAIIFMIYELKSHLDASGFGKVHQQANTPAVTTTCFFHVGGFLTATLALEKRVTYNHVSTYDLISIIQAWSLILMLG